MGLGCGVGVHSGFYFANGFFPTEGVVYGVQLLVQILAMGLFGLVVLGVPRRLGFAGAGGEEDYYRIWR